MTKRNGKKEKKKIETKRKSIRFICTWPLLLSMDYLNTSTGYFGCHSCISPHINRYMEIWDIKQMW